MNRLAIIVTGDRHATEDRWFWVVEKKIVDAMDDVGYTVLIHGCAPGIDGMAGQIGEGLCDAVIPMPAPWETMERQGHNRNAAGPHRNVQMVNVLKALREVGYEVRVLAFHDDLAGSKGTRHCVNYARSALIPVTVYGSDGGEQ